MLYHDRPELPSVRPLVDVYENIVAGVVEQTHKSAEQRRLVVRDNQICKPHIEANVQKYCYKTNTST